MWSLAYTLVKHAWQVIHTNLIKNHQIKFIKSLKNIHTHLKERLLTTLRMSLYGHISLLHLGFVVK